MSTPEKYKNATWDKVPEQIKETIRNNPTKGLYIHGEVGIGKTHIAHGIADRALNKQSPLPIRFYNFSDLLRLIRDSYGKKYDAYYDNPLNTILAFNGLLIIDDLGAEKVTEWAQETLYEIVNKRYEDKLVTIFTSNLNIQNLADKVGDRIVSRIVEMCSIIEVKGDDRRMENIDKVTIKNNG